uniref:hypothetical protein n=1 Tax=Bradyrhizobium japonicum TaxID=375 RepID=UPI0035A0F2ED
MALLERFWQARHPPRYAAFLTPSSPRFRHSSLFGKWSGTEVKIDGVDLLIMKESDIMGVLDVPASKKKAA